jgi:hypothetical protein
MWHTDVCYNIYFNVMHDENKEGTDESLYVYF